MKHILRILLLALTLLGACTKGGQSDTPGGSALEVDDPEGKLMVSASRIEVSPERPMATLYATYINSKGLYDPSAITVEPYVPSVPDGNHAVFTLGVGNYTVRAGKLSLSVTVTLKNRGGI